MEEIILTKTLVSKLNELERILFEKEYFGFLDSAEHYVHNIYDFIYTIPEQQQKLCSNSQHGKYYCAYHPNRQTTYYITFDKKENKYIIRNVFTNHTPDYPEFIQGLK